MRSCRILVICVYVSGLTPKLYYLYKNEIKLKMNRSKEITGKIKKNIK